MLFWIDTCGKPEYPRRKSVYLGFEEWGKPGWEGEDCRKTTRKGSVGDCQRGEIKSLIIPEVGANRGW